MDAISVVISFLVIIFLIKTFYFLVINTPTVFDNIIAFIKWLWSIVLWPFKMLKKLKNFIVKLHNERLERKRLRKSLYNVNPSGFKIPLIKRLFSRRIIKEERIRLSYVAKCEETQEFVNKKIKYLSRIETSVGGGKTSLMSGLTHYFTIKFKNEIEEKISNTKKILYFLDWNSIDNKIEEIYKTDKRLHVILKTILDDEKIEEDIEDKFYDNYRQETPYISLLEDYIAAFCARLRNNYVISNYKLKNRITDTFNIVLRSDLLNIKDKAAKDKYYVPYYSLIVEDELSLNDDTKNTIGVKEVDELGRDMALRLFRQLFQETVYYVGASQNTTREVKLTRELSNMYIEILSLDVVGTQKTFSRIFQKKENKLLDKLDENPSIEDKERIYNFYQEQNKVFAAGFVKYKIRYAHKLKAMDRYNDDSVHVVDLFFPITWCFGTYQKCQFQEVDKFLKKTSQKSDDDLMVVKDLYSSSSDETLSEMLKTRSQKKKEKEELEKNQKNEVKPKGKTKKKEGEDK